MAEAVTASGAAASEVNIGSKSADSAMVYLQDEVTVTSLFIPCIQPTENVKTPSLETMSAQLLALASVSLSVCQNTDFRFSEDAKTYFRHCYILVTS